MELLEHLRRFQHQAPVRVEEVIRSFDVGLDMNALLHPDIVGQIERSPDGYLISVQANDHPNRKRFTAAHELGHYLYHRDLLEDGVDDDKMYRSKNIGRFYNRNIRQHHETEANKFASWLIMPQALVRSWHNRLHGELKPLARQFEVSPAAMRIRLQTLGLPIHE